MTDANFTSAFIKAALCGMTHVVQTNQGFEVTLPQMFHTGHAVVVVVSKVPNGFVIHDNSYAAMLLSQLGHGLGASTEAEIAKQIAYYDCAIENMKVLRRCDRADDIALSSVLVGCASRLIADHALAIARTPLFDFRAQIVTKVTEAVGSRRVRRNEAVQGHLGGSYQVSAVVLDIAEKRPVAFVEPISSKESIARKFKEFYDISRNGDYANVDRVAVYDEAKGFAPSDILLMQEVGNPVRFADASKRFAAWATVQ